MRRKNFNYLKEWKTRHDRKPLIVRGARQVGKTWLIEHFGKECFDHFLTVDFEKHLTLINILENKSAKEIIDELSLFFNQKIIPGKTLLFFDEVQSFPYIIKVLRYFYEDISDLHVIAAGSLLDFMLNELPYSMPVGRIEFMYMYPLDFYEFLYANKQEQLVECLKTFNVVEGIPESGHIRLLEMLRLYFFIGGMPEAVAEYCETQDLISIQRIQESVLTSFQNDFNKYGKSRQVLLAKVLPYLGMNPCIKIKYSNISRNDRTELVKETVELLEMARLTKKVIHSSANGIPLKTQQNERHFKTVFLDIGLSMNLCGIRLPETDNLMTVMEGLIAEQYIGQQLQALEYEFKEPDLFYWHREAKNSNAELDYLFSFNNTVFPLKVKAGAKGSLKSMHMFLAEKDLYTGIVLNTNNACKRTYQVKDMLHSCERKIELVNLPLYAILELPRILSSA